MVLISPICGSDLVRLRVIRRFLSLALLIVILDKQVSCNTSGIHLKLISSSDDIILQCTVFKYDPQTKVHFLCSVNDSDDRCYEECINVGKLSIFLNCTKESISDSVVLTYVVKKSTMPTGSYRCMYKSYVSHSLAFTKEIKPLKESNSQSPIILRKEILMILLSILTLSIILNLLFFIRCFATRRIIGKQSTAVLSPAKKSMATCLCIETNANVDNKRRKPFDDVYDNIREMHPDFDADKSKSSGDHESQNFLISPTPSQLTRSSTFPYKQSVLVHTPTEQLALSTMSGQPYLMPNIIEGGQCVMGPVLNHRLSIHGCYDDIAAESVSTTMPIRQFASTGSLNHRPKRYVSSHSKASPLPEENQSLGALFTNRPLQAHDGTGSIENDISSRYDVNSSKEAYISGNERDSYKDPVRAAKLEMSKEMMAKADTLLREAHNLLK